MAFSSRLSKHTKSSLAKAKPGSPPRQKPQKQKDAKSAEGGSNQQVESDVKAESGAPKLPHTRPSSKKNSSFVDSLEEKTLELEGKSEKNKYTKTKFQSSEKSPQSKMNADISAPSDDFSLEESVQRIDEVLFMPSPELERNGRHKGVLGKSYDSSMASHNGSRRDKVLYARNTAPSVSIDLEELRIHHSWCNGEFTDEPELLDDKMGFLGETSPVSVLDFRQELLDEPPHSPVSADGAEEPKDLATKVEEAPLDEASGVTGYFVGISSEQAADIGGNEQDLEYVQHVLQISGFGGHRLPAWFSDTTPINPSVFEHLELEIAVGTTFGIESFEKVNNSDRHQRKLLFDAVNEALAQALRPFVELPQWVDRKTLAARSRPVGCELLEEIWFIIQSWPIPGSDDLFEVLDEAARRDMISGPQNWEETGKEEASVVFQIERLLLDEMIEELIDDLGVAELNQTLCESEGSENEFPVIF